MDIEIERVISAFELQLRELGFSDDTGALLVQINIGGKSYIMSRGNLNNLSAPTLIHGVNNGINFIDFMESEIHTANVGDSTKKLHFDTHRQLRDYKQYQDIRDVNSDFLFHLETFMRKEKGLSINTIARHMKVIKRYINIARKKEIIFKDPFLNYTIRSEETHREALSEKELELLEQYRQRSDSDEIINAFLFSCYTGLRYSDICNITKQDIYSINRKKWLIMKMHKTNIEVRIPVSTIFDGKALLLSKSIPRSRGRIFLLESNQKTNRGVKSILKKIGIKRNISFHTARHINSSYPLKIRNLQRLLA